MLIDDCNISVNKNHVIVLSCSEVYRINCDWLSNQQASRCVTTLYGLEVLQDCSPEWAGLGWAGLDRKSTRLNSSHL